MIFVWFNFFCLVAIFFMIFLVLYNMDRDLWIISNSRVFYFVIGFLMGLILVGVEEGLSCVFFEFLIVAFLVVVMIIVIRGFYLDGLMDVFDGVFGGFMLECCLEIMCDF